MNKSTLLGDEGENANEKGKKEKSGIYGECVE